MDMFYSLSCPTVILSLTVWENDRKIGHYWTKAHILDVDVDVDGKHGRRQIASMLVSQYNLQR